ncbi:hypothetical protein FOA52_010553 [Chlamydomonas sp. UWO 241]|nr:hypothetical protein FOA52_010553 [Chlamydomonas sp. UWO 241]
MPGPLQSAFACVPAGMAACAHALRFLGATLTMLVYVILLLPGFLQMVVYYFASPSVLRHIPYGSGRRQQLDLYLPPAVASSSSSSDGEEDAGTPRRPVVIFISGGAWTIGYKAWGALLARRLSECGCLVACLDYRNYPRGTPAQMLEDVNTGVAWVVRNAYSYGGDAGRITLVGQSAGAHLGALALFSQCEREAAAAAGGGGGGRSTGGGGGSAVAAAAAAVVSSGGSNGPHASTPASPRLQPGGPKAVHAGATPEWSPSDVQAFVGISGVYDLPAIAEHLHRRGFGQGVLERIFVIDGQPALAELSPLERAKRWLPATSRRVPRCMLLHGTADQSSPHEGSVQLHDALLACGVLSELQLVDGKGHTAFLLEGPMKGGPDLLSDAILRVVKGVEQTHIYPTLNPGFLCDLAERICPF